MTTSPLPSIAEGHETLLPDGSALTGSIPLRSVVTPIATDAVDRSALFPGTQPCSSGSTPWCESLRPVAPVHPQELARLLADLKNLGKEERALQIDLSLVEVESAKCHFLSCP